MAGVSSLRSSGREGNTTAQLSVESVGILNAIFGPVVLHQKMSDNALSVNLPNLAPPPITQWNPAALTQATDHAQRIGQCKPVFVHKLMVAGEEMMRLRRRQQPRR
jgi:hypothetical protein